MFIVRQIFKRTQKKRWPLISLTWAIEYGFVSILMIQKNCLNMAIRGNCPKQQQNTFPLQVLWWNNVVYFHIFHVRGLLFWFGLFIHEPRAKHNMTRIYCTHKSIIKHKSGLAFVANQDSYPTFFLYSLCSNFVRVSSLGASQKWSILEKFC